jgi:hypothetical protein
MENLKMTRPIHRIYQADGSFIDRPYTDEEMVQLEKDKLEIEKLRQNEAEAQSKRQALLDKLGITEDEARLLLGGN